MEQDKQTFAGGATRSHLAPAFHLIPFAGLRRIAQRWRLGEIQHGRDNWKKADRAFVEDIPNHMVEHLWKWMQGDRSEDHLAAVGWGAVALMHFEENPPEESRDGERA